jgi:heme exporter protein CcmD
MSPYAFYVWTAYGVSFAGIAAAAVLTWRARSRARARLAALEKQP